MSQQPTTEKSLFLNHFYKYSMHRLMAPLMAQTATETVSKGECVDLGKYSLTQQCRRSVHTAGCVSCNDRSACKWNQLIVSSNRRVIISFLLVASIKGRSAPSALWGIKEPIVFHLLSQLAKEDAVVLGNGFCWAHFK